MTRGKQPLLLVTALVLLISLSVGLYVRNASGSTVPEPGSAEDPLVSLTYLQSYVQSQLGTASGGSYQVVTIKSGQLLQCGAGTEVIVRVGNAQVVGNSQGDGIPNVSEGRDLRNGEKVPLQHLLVIPRDDGRGIKGLPTGSSGQDLIYLMVRGKYTVK